MNTRKVPLRDSKSLNICQGNVLLRNFNCPIPIGRLCVTTAVKRKNLQTDLIEHPAHVQCAYCVLQQDSRNEGEKMCSYVIVQRSSKGMLERIPFGVLRLLQRR